MSESHVRQEGHVNVSQPIQALREREAYKVTGNEWVILPTPLASELHQTGITTGGHSPPPPPPPPSPFCCVTVVPWNNPSMQGSCCCLVSLSAGTDETLEVALAMLKGGGEGGVCGEGGAGCGERGYTR